MMPVKTFGCAVICAVLTLSLPACGGGGAKTNVNASSTTMGQELIDLNTSYEQGLISASQYNRAKKDILRKYDN
jgi:hypothetical protein